MKKLSVIIVNYNVCYFLEQALLSVRKAAAGMAMEVLVVDNHSVDGSVEMVRRRFPEVTLIANAANVGFSRANNQAIRLAKGQYVLLLNPDTVVEEDTFARCCQFMDEHPEAGGLGVKMLDGKGGFLPESKRSLPTPEVAFYKIFGLSALFPKSRVFGRYHLSFLNPDQVHEVDVLSGAFMLMRRSVLDQVGLLDEDYFMYGEDVDLSYRIRQAGYKNFYFPHTRIIHYKGESTKKSSVNYVVVFYKAMVIFARKHFSSDRAGLFSLLIHLAIFLRAGVALLWRVLRSLWPMLLDATLIYVGIAVLKEYWEGHLKREPTAFPPEFMQVAVPVYVLIWLVSTYFSGGYDAPFKPRRAIRGILFGTILISAFTNFVDAYRFSKGLILVGGLWAGMVLVGWRLVAHVYRHRNLRIGEPRPKQIAIVGSGPESARVTELLQLAKVKAKVIGFVNHDSQAAGHLNYLGDLGQLEEIIRINRLDELIFCGKDLGATQIIEVMLQSNNQAVEFKILPEESQYIIGSSSKNNPGDYYGLPLELNLLKKFQQRNKQVLDVVLSLLFLVLSPVLVWAVANKKGFFRNCLRVLSRSRSWVGIRSTHNHLPASRKAVLSPVDRHHRSQALDEQTRRRLELAYARDYTPWQDVAIVFSCFRDLGRAT